MPTFAYICLLFAYQLPTFAYHLPMLAYCFITVCLPFAYWLPTFSYWLPTFSYWLPTLSYSLLPITYSLFNPHNPLPTGCPHFLTVCHPLPTPCLISLYCLPLFNYSFQSVHSFMLHHHFKCCPPAHICPHLPTLWPPCSHFCPPLPTCCQHLLTLCAHFFCHISKLSIMVFTPQISLYLFSVYWKSFKT